MPPCNLCQLVSDGPPARRVYEDDYLIVLVDTSAGPMQMLVIPKLHEESLDALGTAGRSHLYKISERAGRSLHLAAGLDLGAEPAVLAADAGHAHLRVRAQAGQV